MIDYCHINCLMVCHLGYASFYEMFTPNSPIKLSGIHPNFHILGVASSPHPLFFTQTAQLGVIAQAGEERGRRRGSKQVTDQKREKHGIIIG